MFQPDKLKHLLDTPDVAKADPQSLAGFIAWLETKSVAEEYNWWSTVNCVVGQYRSYVRAHGGFTGVTPLLDILGDGYYEISRPLPWTFGAALLRARAYRDSVSA